MVLTMMINKIADFLNLSLDVIKFEQIENGGLSIKKTSDNITVKYSEKAYMFRALGILSEHINEDSFSISETPRFHTNGVMLDCSRNGVTNIKTLKDILIQLALMGHNLLMLYTEDTYEIEGEPYFGYMRGRYTHDELREIDDYANELGIELIPCIQTLGHCAKFLRWSNAYGEITDTGDILLAEEEKTYEFIEKMISSCRKVFRSNKIHIGMDETHELGKGKYLEFHGSFNKAEIYEKHLNRVNLICVKYGYEPMIWGDLPFSVGALPRYTDCSERINFKRCSDIKIPENIGFIYWDYYSMEKSRYEELIDAHKKYSNKVIFGGGAWRWANFVPNITRNLKPSVYALQSCFEKDVKNVFVTLWGDDANESSVFCSWNIVQLYAEYNFRGDNWENEISQRFKTCTGGIWEDFLKLELPNLYNGYPSADPCKYLFYQDPLLGLFDKHIPEKSKEIYSDLAKEFFACAKRNSKYDYMFKNIAVLCQVLSIKASLGVDIKNAYDNKDNSKLSEIANIDLPQLITYTEQFNKSFAKQWITENKIFGYQTMDMRIGSVINRLKSTKDRLKDYINGDIEILEELEVKRLPFNGSTNNEEVYAYGVGNIYI